MQTKIITALPVIYFLLNTSCGITVVKGGDDSEHPAPTESSSSRRSSVDLAQEALEYFLPTKSEAVMNLKGTCAKSANWSHPEYVMVLKNGNNYSVEEASSSIWRETGKFETSSGNLDLKDNQKDFMTNSYPTILECSASETTINESDLPVLSCLVSDEHGPFLFRECGHVDFVVGRDLQEVMDN